MTKETQPKFFAEKKPLALVMKGGGVKGLAYVSAVEELNERYHFDWFVGTSAGAITALLLAAGYTPKELEEILKKKNFSDFFDASWLQKWWNLAIHHGFYKGDAFTEWLDRLLAEKLKSQTRVRLSDLPNRVTIYASQRNKPALKFDSLENDADAAYAARCSMSIPFIFVPQTYQGIRSYDGALQHNYPVDELLRTNPETEFISLYLGSKHYEPVRDGPVWRDLMSIVTDATDQETLKKYSDRTVIIDTRPISTLDFDLSDTEKQFLLACGRAGALAHLEGGGEKCKAAVRSEERLRCKITLHRERRCRKKKMGVWGRRVLLIAAVAFAAWFVFKLADPTRSHLIFSSDPKFRAVQSSALDPSMQGIVVHLRDVEIDLRNEVPVPAEERDTERVAPSLQTYTIHAERIADDAKYLIYEFASQRKLLDIACISSDPYAVWYRQDKLPLGQSFNNVWTLVIDVTQHARDIPFTVKFRVTRYNAYQAENHNFVGHLVSGDEEEILTTVYLPDPLRLASIPKVEQKVKGDQSAKWTNYSGFSEITISLDRRSFFWKMSKPKPGYAYYADINWTNAPDK